MKLYRTPSKYSLKGISDILGILPTGKLLAIEVKTPKGRLSQEQKAFLNKIKSKGGMAFVARSVSDVAKQLTNNN